MAVLRSKRQTAKTEFENTFSKLYQLTRKHTLDVPRRRKRWLCKNVNEVMNLLYRSVVEINDYYHPEKEQKEEHRVEVINKAIGYLYDLEKPLMIMWNVQRFDTDKMGIWADLINQEIFLLNKIHPCAERTGGVMILDWRVINSVEFLKNMSNLHRYTHGKVASAKMDYDDTEGELLISTVNDAFYCLIQANKKIPTTRKEYEKRREYISRAIMCLRELNRHLLSYFNLMQYSERIMNEWTLLLTQELKLLFAIQKSDKKRFGNLT